MQIKELWIYWNLFGSNFGILDLQIEEPSANWRTIYKSKNYRSRSKNYIQPKNCICRLKKYICRSNNYIGSADWRYYLLIINCLQIKEVFDLQVEEVPMDQRTIFRKKFVLWIEKVFDLQIEEVYADWQIANQRSIWSADRRIICRWKN